MARAFGRNKKRDANRENRYIYNRAIEHAKHILMSGRYAPGASKDRIRNDWLSSIKSMTDLISTEWETLVARSELATRTNAYAKNARNIILDHIVGTGLKPTPAVMDKDGMPAEKINGVLSEDWKRFNDQCIRTGVMATTFYEAQRIFLGTMFDQGSILLNTVSSRKGSHLPFAFQLLKPSRLDFHRDTYTWSDTSIPATEGQIVHGMKFNEFNEPTEFYIDNETKPFPASRMRLFFHQIEAEQYLGIPWLTPVLPFTWDLDHLLQDKIIAHRIVTNIALWIKKTDRKGLDQITDTDDDTVPWERGAIMSTNEKPEVVQPDSDIEQGFQPLTRIYLHGIGAGLGFSYTLLTRDLDKANFASTQFNTIADNRYFQTMFKIFSKTVCQYVYEEFVKMEFMSGKIPGKTLADYRKDQWHYNQCYWLPTLGREWVDPLKNANALEQAYRTGYITLQELCSIKGKDWKQIARQRADEKRLLKELDLSEMLPGDLEKIQTGEDVENDGERSLVVRNGGFYA
jgi:lambda family phage portal protein